MSPHLQDRLRQGGRTAFNSAWGRGITPRVKRRPSQWAAEMRKMPIGGPVSKGQVVSYDHAYTPHCIEQMDAADDPDVRMIVIWEGIREGKTNGVCLNIIGRQVTDDPGGIFSVHPTESDVEKFSSDDMEPLIELSLKGYFVDKKSRDPGRTKDFKKYRGGSVRIVSAGSITKFRGSTVKALFLHEADALVVESIYKALGRTEGLSDAVIVMESTGTLAPEITPEGETRHRSVISEHYLKGDMRKWFCACAACGALQWLKYEQLRFSKSRMEETLYHCERCDHGHDEAAWKKMAAEGKWYPTAGLDAEQLQDIANTHHLARAKQPEVRSYWRNGFTNLFPKSKGYATKLHQFVAQGEAAKSSPEALKTWTNEIAAELWNPDATAVDPPQWKPMYDRRERYDLAVPEGGLFVTSFTDVHDNRLETLWQAWGRNEESWVLDHVVLQGSVFQKHVWQLLRRELGRRFRHSFGCDIGLGFGLIDGGDNAEEVYRFLQELARNPEPGVTGNLRASRGAGAHPHPLIGPYGSISKNLKGHWIGTWQAKKILYTERFRMVPPEGWEQRLQSGDPLWLDDRRAGIIHFNERCGQELFEQMVRERPVMRIIKGDEVMAFENPGKQRNEGLDLLVGNLAAVRFYSRPWDLLEADLKERAEALKRPAQPRQETSSRQDSYILGGARW